MKKTQCAICLNCGRHFYGTTTLNTDLQLAAHTCVEGIKYRKVTKHFKRMRAAQARSAAALQELFKVRPLCD